MRSPFRRIGAFLATGALALTSSLLSTSPAQAAVPTEASTSANGWYVTGDPIRTATVDGPATAGATFSTSISYAFPAQESGWVVTMRWDSNTPGTLNCDGVLRHWTNEGAGIAMKPGVPSTWQSQYFRLSVLSGTCTFTGTIPEELANEGKPVRQTLTISSANEVRPPVVLDAEKATTTVEIDTVAATPEQKLSLSVTSDPVTRAVPGFDKVASILVTNDGTVPFTRVGAADDPQVVCPQTGLDVNASMTCTVTFHPTEWGVTYTHPTQIVAVTADGREVRADVTASVTTFKDARMRAFQEAPSTPVEPGTTGTALMTVANAGQITITDITPMEDGNVCPKQTLAPGESMQCSVTVPTTAGAYGTEFSRSVSYAAFAEDGRSLRSQAAAVVTTIGTIAFEAREGQPATPVEAGTPGVATVVLANPGQTDLIDVLSSTPGASCPATTLAAGASMECTVQIPTTTPSTTAQVEAVFTARAADGRTVSANVTVAVTTKAASVAFTGCANWNRMSMSGAVALHDGAYTLTVQVANPILKGVSTADVSFEIVNGAVVNARYGDVFGRTKNLPASSLSYENGVLSVRLAPRHMVTTFEWLPEGWPLPTAGFPILEPQWSAQLGSSDGPIVVSSTTITQGCR